MMIIEVNFKELPDGQSVKSFDIHVELNSGEVVTTVKNVDESKPRESKPIPPEFLDGEL